MAVQCPPDTQQKPSIAGEEDLPFPSGSELAREGDIEAEVELKARKQEHDNKVEDYKNVVGGIILFACFLIIVFFALVDAYMHIESVLFTGAFEFAKTIATAVIGYLFASNINTK